MTAKVGSPNIFKYMQSLKESTEWRIGAIYYAIGGLFIPQGVKFIVTLIVTKIVEAIFVPIYFLIILDFITITLALWFGTSYSAKYISERYIIKKKDNIVKNAVIFFVLIQLGGLGVLLGGQERSFFGLVLFETIFAVGLFHFLSTKCIKNTEIISPME